MQSIGVHLHRLHLNHSPKVCLLTKHVDQAGAADVHRGTPDEHWDTEETRRLVLNLQSSKQRLQRQVSCENIGFAFQTGKAIWRHRMSDLQNATGCGTAATSASLMLSTAACNPRLKIQYSDDIQFLIRHNRHNYLPLNANLNKVPD